MTNDMLKINDLFHTIQGEGKHAGRRALFVRMPYCNLACTWCDTTFNSFTTLSESDFIKFATQERCKFAVITGGEPMMNRQTRRVIDLLKQLNFEIACESNGMFPILEGIDFVTVSPKRFSDQKTMLPSPMEGERSPQYPSYHVHQQAFERAHEFKYVVDRPFDFSILNRHDTKDGRRYSLSPEYNDFDINVRAILEYIKGHPDWLLSLQTHKWIGVP